MNPPIWTAKHLKNGFTAPVSEGLGNIESSPGKLWQHISDIQVVSGEFSQADESFNAV